MIIFGLVVSAVGGALFLLGLWQTVTANVHARIPYLANAAKVPVGSIAARSAGAGLMIAGAAALGQSAGLWAISPLVGVSAATVVAIAVHNRSIDRRSVHTKPS